MNLTPRQLDVLVAIRNYRHLHGYSPTMQELADQLGTSKVTIFEHVGALEKKRVLRRDKHKNNEEFHERYWRGRTIERSTFFRTADPINEARLSRIAPVSTNLILAYVGQHVLGMPRSY